MDKIISNYKKAAFPCLCVETVEEERFTKQVFAEIADLEAEMNKAKKSRGEKTNSSIKLLSISATGGLKALSLTDQNVISAKMLDAKAKYSEAFAKLPEFEDSILLVFDFQHIVRNAGAYRSLKDVFPDLEAHGCLIILVGPSWNLPAELQHDIPILQYALPDRDGLNSALEIALEATGEKVGDKRRAALLDAATGLSWQEAKNNFCLSRMEKSEFHAPTVQREKERLIRASGFLEVWQAVDPREVGGLDALKMYILNECIPVKDDDQLRVKGVILVGVQGTGKSLSAKATAALMGWPLIRLDVSRCKGGLVGQSENQLASAFKMADAMAPAVLWIDEIEKAYAGSASSAHTDGGTSLGMEGITLTWLQEHKSPVFVVATCNDFRKLSPEMTRAGRFDERFFVDLPTRGEREEIAKVHLARFGCPVDLAGMIAETALDFTGAEIEQLIKSAARRSARKVTEDVIRATMPDIKPIAHVRREEIEQLRDWAKNSLRMANSPETTKTGRKVQI